MKTYEFSSFGFSGDLIDLRYGEFTDRQVINLAEEELARMGSSFEELAGLALVDDSDGATDWEYRITDNKQLLDLAIQKLSDDGRVFRPFTYDFTGVKPVVVDTHDPGCVLVTWEHSGHMLQCYAIQDPDDGSLCLDDKGWGLFLGDHRIPVSRLLGRQFEKLLNP